MAESLVLMLIVLVTGALIGLLVVFLRRASESSDEKIEKLKQRARERNITGGAIQIARTLGTRQHDKTCEVANPDFLNSLDESVSAEFRNDYSKISHRRCERNCRNYRYEDSVIVVHLSETNPQGVGIWHKIGGKEAVFKAGYTESELYEYSTGKYLEPRDGGGYDVKEEYRTGGGFSEEIVSYIPGDWEVHFKRIHKEASAKAKLEERRRNQEIEEKERKRFGL